MSHYNSSHAVLKEQRAVFLSPDRLYPVHLTFSGSILSLGIDSVRVYASVGSNVVALDSTNSYFVHDKLLRTAVIVSGLPSLSRSTAVVSSTVATAGQYFTFELSLRDAFWNHVMDWDSAHVLVSSNSTSQQRLDVNSDLKLSLVLTVSGLYSISTPLSSIEQISIDILVLGSKIHPGNSELKLTLSEATAGVPVSLTVIAKDMFGNIVPNDYYDVLAHSIVEQESSVAEIPIATLAASNASVYAIFTSSGQYRAIVKSNRKFVGTYFDIRVQPSAVCMSLVSMTGSGLTVATNGLESHFTILSRDSYGNVHREAQWAAFETSAEQYHYLSSLHVGSHIHFLRRPGPMKEFWSMSVFHYAPGSLTATFYANTHFSGPVSVDDVDISAQMVSDLSNKIFRSKSVRFSGFVRVDRSFTASFAFTNCHSTSTRVRVDGVTVYSCNYSVGHLMSPGSWIFLEVEHASLQINEASAPAARTLVTESASSAFFASVSVYKVYQANGSPFKIRATPGFPYSQAFLARGSGLSLCTSGLMAAFSVAIRDAFSLPTSLSGSVLEIAVAHQNSSANSSVLRCSSSVVESNVCKFSYFCGSKSIKLCRSKALIPGLIGEYHETASFNDYMQPLATQGFSRIDYSFTFESASSLLSLFDASVNHVAAEKLFRSPYLSARWSGLLQARFTEVYTLKCTSFGGVKLYIDGLVILNKPSSSERKAVQGTVAFAASAFVEIRIDYVQDLGQFGMKLEWQSRSQSISEIPTSAFWHSEIGTLPEYVVSVAPATPLLSSSSINGPGLTIATSGTASTFTVHVFDAIGLPAALNNSQLLARAHSLGGPTFSPIRQALIASGIEGSYVFSYIPFIAGEHIFDVMQLTPGSLISTMYASSAFQNPMAQDGSLGIKLDKGYFAEHVQASSLALRMSASWRGFFQPASSPITTFQIHLGSATDRVKFVVDGITLVDKMSFSSSSVTSVSATIVLSDTNSFYDIAIDFAHASGALKFAVATQHGEIPETRLFHSRAIGTPLAALIVRAGSACAATSKLIGVGAVQVLSSGVPGSLELHIRDAYNNPTSAGTRQIHASAHSASCLADELLCETPVRFDTNEVSDSVWNIVALVTRSGKWNVAVAFAKPGFVYATYYSSAGFMSPVSTAPVALNSKLTVECESLRMSGFISPLPSFGNVSFKWLGHHDYYPSLFVDSPFGGARGPNYTQSAEVSAVISDSMTVSRMRDLRIDVPYVHPGFQPSLLWSYDIFSWVEVPSQRLFAREDIQTFLIDVLSAMACTATSYIFGDSITVATCGLEKTFSIISRDQYSNNQNGFQDKWVVRVSRNDTATTLATSDPANSHRVVLPAATASARYFISGEHAMHAVARMSHRMSRFLQSAVSRPSLIGLTGSYFSNSMFQGQLERTQIDQAVAFEWKQVLQLKMF